MMHFGLSVINENIGLAVDDRHHGEIMHLAHTVSLCDLYDQDYIQRQIFPL